MSQKTTALLALARSTDLPDREALTAAIICAADTMLARDALTLKRDAAVKELEETYNLEIELLDGTVDDYAKKIERYAKKNRTALFQGAHTITIAGHAISWRKSPGKVDTKKGISQTDAVEAIIDNGDKDFQSKYLSVKATLDKNAILKAYDEEKGNPTEREQLDTHGITVTYPELFQFKPNQASVTEK